MACKKIPDTHSFPKFESSSPAKGESSFSSFQGPWSTIDDVYARKTKMPMRCLCQWQKGFEDDD